MYLLYSKLLLYLYRLNGTTDGSDDFNVCRMPYSLSENDILIKEQDPCQSTSVDFRLPMIRCSRIQKKYSADLRSQSDWSAVRTSLASNRRVRQTALSSLAAAARSAKYRIEMTCNFSRTKAKKTERHLASQFRTAYRRLQQCVIGNRPV